MKGRKICIFYEQSLPLYLKRDDICRWLLWITNMMSYRYPIDLCQFRWPSVTFKGVARVPIFPMSACMNVHTVWSTAIKFRVLTHMGERSVSKRSTMTHRPIRLSPVFPIFDSRCKPILLDLNDQTRHANTCLEGNVSRESLRHAAIPRGGVPWPSPQIFGNYSENLWKLVDTCLHLLKLS